MTLHRLGRRTLLGGAAALAGLALGSREARAAVSVEEALREIDAARAGLKLLFAPFEQTRVLGLLASEVKSRGELTVLRPDRLRWELAPPDAVTYWLGPEGVSYRSGDGKVARAPADARFGAILGDLLAFVAGDPGRLRDRYELGLLRVPTGLGLEARPKTADLKKLVSRLELVTNEERWGLERVIIEEPTGDSSTMRFGKNEKNPPLDLARLKPPS